MGVTLMFIGDILASVKPYVSFPKIWTTNLVFQLHSKVSALLLFTACLCVTAAQFFGDPIDCIVEVAPAPAPAPLATTAPACPHVFSYLEIFARWCPRE